MLTLIHLFLQFELNRMKYVTLKKYAINLKQGVEPLVIDKRVLRPNNS